MTNQTNPWKITAIALSVIAATVLFTTYVIGQRTDSQRSDPETAKQRIVSHPSPNGSIGHHSRVQAHIVDCNREAADRGNGKTMELVKDAAVGALGGAVVGVGGGAIAQGGSGAGKDAAIGGIIGSAGGTLYGLNENKQRDEEYRKAYAACMGSKGYG